jgi:DNA repair exonuclease SbcCD ATPase subunit
MRLVRLVVENFACVAEARVEFGPGLNVLFGPNELGKSTLAMAIRAALLLPFGSKAHEPWRNWSRDDSPTVELVFQTEPQRYWRIQKEFGERGTAVFDESKDGVHFSNVAKARQVDAEIRKLLTWGIPEPGGPGSKGGMPQSFLTAVLLPLQNQVTGIFTKSLDNDPCDTGKQRLIQVLQALATDPTFSRVFEEALKKVHEVYTSQGKRKSSQSSPLVQIGKEILQTKSELEELNQQVIKGDESQQRIAALHDQRSRLLGELDEARRELGERQRLWETRRQIEQRLETARSDLERAVQIERELSTLAGEIAEREQGVQRLGQQVTSAQQDLQTADAALHKAREQLQNARSQEHAAQRQIRRQALENKLLELAGTQRDAAEHLKQIELAQRAVQSVADCEEQVRRLQATTDVLQRQEAEVGHTEDKARDELQQLDGVERWLAWQEATAKYKQAEEALAQGTAARADADRKRAEAGKIKADIAARALPTPDQLQALCQLDHDLRLAETELAVGLSVLVQPLLPFKLQATRDGGKPTTHSLRSKPLEIEAERLLSLTVGDVAQIVISGGTTQHRERAAELRRRWDTEAPRILQAASATSLAELETMCRQAAKETQQAVELGHESDKIMAGVNAQGDLAARCAELRHRVADCEVALAEHDRRACEKQAKREPLGPQDRAARRKQAETRLKHAMQHRGELRTQLARQQEQLESARRNRDAAQKQQADLLGRLPADLTAAAKAARDQLAQVDRNQQQAQQELRAMSGEADTAISKAEAELQAAETQRAERAKQIEQLRQQCHRADTEWAELRGKLDAKRQAASGVSSAAAREQVTAIERELAAVPHTGRPLSEQTLRHEAENIERVELRVRNLVSQIQTEEAMYRATGGETIRDRRDSLKEAYEHQMQREHEIETEYAAWQLLAETLRVAEKDQATHLGRAIVPAISQRFNELTAWAGRQIELGPNLDGVAIIANGARRPLEQLSIGTQDQLGTILRLALAEQLQSMLLLDDQLTQTDPARMDWFRRLFHESAGKTQIVVLTCRPADYLEPGDLPASSERARDSTDRLVRAINLGSVVRNFPRDNSAAS